MVTWYTPIILFKRLSVIEDDDVYWCTADIGWITGHSYIVYGPPWRGHYAYVRRGAHLSPSRKVLEIVEKYKVNQFYAAPTAIRALQVYGTDPVEKFDLSSLKVIGSVGEPINEEAWHWYHEHIGKGGVLW